MAQAKGFAFIPKLVASYGLLLACLWCSWPLCAQLDTFYLPVVSVQDSLLPPVGIYTDTWSGDSIPLGLGADIAELLASESLVFVRQAGPGQVATISQAGGTAAQTSILWNGLPIQSPMLGLQDFSLVPASAFDQISLTSGGSSSTSGSSGISGTLQVQQKRPAAGSKLEVGAQGGSFGARSQVLRWSAARRLWAWRIYGQQRRAANNYPVRQPNFWRDSLLPHAAWQQYVAQGEVYRQFSVRDEVALRYWYQFTKRELPPDLRVRQSLATQQDESNRLSLSWQRRQSRGLLQLQGAWFREAIHYRD
ncbi:MAG: Plug domain-containing protein, partial [Bacteroidetes bacterium]